MTDGPPHPSPAAVRHESRRPQHLPDRRQHPPDARQRLQPAPQPGLSDALRVLSLSYTPLSATMDVRIEIGGAKQPTGSTP